MTNANHVSLDQTTDAFGREPGDIDYRILRGRVENTDLRAAVTLFKPSGKYYTTETWRVPVGAINPFGMADSPDFRRIDGGPVLIEANLSIGNGHEHAYTWGIPALL